MNNKQKAFIKNVQLKDFRLINDITFSPGKNLNIISGKNGTAKSTIIGMLAQGFSFNPSIIHGLSQKDYEYAQGKVDTNSCDLINDYNKTIENYENVLTCSRTKFESTVNEHFKLSKKDAKNKTHAVIDISTGDNFIIESNDYSDRVNPRLVTRKKRAGDSTIDSSNYILPVQYFGLNRLVPLVQSGALKSKNLIIGDKDLKEIYSLYETILLKQYHNNPVSISDSRKKDTISFMDEGRSLEMISSGEDNIGQILLSLFSFKKLRDTYPDYKGGILLIDEIDATLYPAAQLKLIDIIYEKAVNFGIQVFVTSHSIDIIEHSMKLKLNSPYNTHAVKLFNLQNTKNILSIAEVDNIQTIKNEFYAAVDISTQSEKIPVYFEDKEAIYLFNNMISSTSKKHIKVTQDFTLGSNELLKLRKLKIPEFVNQSLVCLDGDQNIPNSYKNYFNLPVWEKYPPEQFIYETICDSNSSYWDNLENYNHSIFMNSPHYNAIQQIREGRYGIEDENDDGLYNLFGSEYFGKKPREVWKMWFNHEKTYFSGKNNPVKYWVRQNSDTDIYKKFMFDFESSLEFVAKEKGINL